MAIITNTFQSTSAKGNRESLSDIVSLITPRDTPIYSDIDHPSMDATFTEWEIDALAAPAANAQLEGDSFTFAAVTPVTRVGNYAQILRKDWSITKTQEAVSNAGNAEKRKQVKLKRGIELRKDVELAIVSNTASVAGATRIAGGLPSWLTTNVSRGGGGGANGGYSSGTKLTVAATNGTQRAFTKTLLDTVMQSCYQSGANVSRIYVSPYVKSVFVTFMSDSNVATFRYPTEKAKGNMIIANADTYAGPFGEVDVVPNRVMAKDASSARNVFLVDTEQLSWPWLRAMQNVPSLAVTSDSEQGVIIGEGTLKVANEAGLGVVADVFGLTAST